MWLVLCGPEDRSALWAYEGLRERGLAPIDVVEPETLTRSARSAHRVDEDRASFEIALPDGRTLASGDIDGLLNRLTWAPVDHLVFASRADTCYAMEEMSALVLSWLRCVAPVAVNRPSPRGLSGAWRSPAEWTVLASAAGLPVSPLSLSSRVLAEAHPYGRDEAEGDASSTATAHTVVVLGDHVFGGDPVRALAPACRRLARLADAELLGIDLDLGDRVDQVDVDRLGGVDRGDVRFLRATPMPDLRVGGDALLDSLHEHLTRLPLETPRPVKPRTSARPR
ncbi:hypothetical protein NPS70_27115 [Streptomyces sp. C10-9-1]|uniref:hypothetical protein n=1 Tax=Streptomyces sp. C10-9-1 TaxID=1859285 RepID=UPI0021115E81|nr:hypothetical protein [Streptomyces sp. C10-9-1]MCQ6556830.1 hypothetical protein [Streptomyces sp. C10-9-1]